MDRKLDVTAARIHADGTDDGDADVTQALHFAVGEGQSRSNRDRITRVHADRVDILDRTYDDDVVRLVAHELKFVFLPAEDRLLQEHLGRDGGGQALAGDALKVLGCVRESGAEAAHREGGTNNEGVAELGGSGVALFHRVSDKGTCDLGTRAFDDLLKFFTVLTRSDRVDRGPNQLNIKSLEHAHLRQSYGRVEGRLTAQGGEEGIGALLLDDRGDDLRADRLDVGGVCDARVGHDGGRVGVDEDDAQAFLLQDTACLRSRVVELTRLADDNGARSDDEDGRQIVPAGHQWVSLAAVIREMKRSKSSSPSCGPAAASGWYWTEKAGMSRARRPSTTPSFRPMCDTSTRPYRPIEGATEGSPTGGVHGEHGCGR